MISKLFQLRRLIPIIIGTAFATVFVLYMFGGTLFLEPEPESTLPDYVATVNGEAITLRMVETELKVSRLNLVQAMPALSGEDLRRASEEALNQLISRHLVLQAAAQAGFQLDDAFIQKRVDILFGSYGDEILDEALKQAGATRADVFWWVSELTTVEEFTVQVVMAEASPENRQRVYNDWLNKQQAKAVIKTYWDETRETFTAIQGNPSPDFTLTTLSGQSVSLADYRGKVVLLNFWATWCPSCIAEMPDYEVVYQKQKANGKIYCIGH